MRAVIWTPLVGRRFRQRLEAHGLEVVVPPDGAAAIAAARAADLLITDGAYDAELAAALRRDKGRLRWIQLVTAGYDGLVAHGVPDGVIVSNVGGFFSPAVAEHAVALLLALLRQLPKSIADTRTGVFDRSGAVQLRSLAGMTVAIIGFGSIGHEVAQRLRPFGVRIIGLVRRQRADSLADEIHTMNELHDVLARADVAIVSVPLVQATRGLIAQREFDLCRRGMILINVSRGEVVDSVALAAALRDGRIAGAGLDVTDPEPLPENHPLGVAPNLIVTPHIAGTGRPGAADAMADLVLGNIDVMATGKPPLHRVEVP